MAQRIATLPVSLFPVRVLGTLFRGKSLAGLVRLHDRGELRLTGPAASLADPTRFACVRDKLYRARWVVYAKPPFGGPEQVFRYLGRYTHRVGLSNRTPLSLHPRRVTFPPGASAPPRPPPVFLSRFILRFAQRLRQDPTCGLMASGNVPTRLAQAKRLLGFVGADRGGYRDDATQFLRVCSRSLLWDPPLPRCAVGVMSRHPSAPTPSAAPWTHHGPRPRPDTSAACRRSA